MFGRLSIKRIVIPNGGTDRDFDFQVGKEGVTKIWENDAEKGAYVVFLEKGYGAKEIDVKSKDILIYWG